MKFKTETNSCTTFPPGSTIHSNLCKSRTVSLFATDWKLIITHKQRKKTDTVQEKNDIQKWKALQVPPRILLSACRSYDLPVNEAHFAHCLLCSTVHNSPGTTPHTNTPGHSETGVVRVLSATTVNRFTWLMRCCGGLPSFWNGSKSMCREKGKEKSYEEQSRQMFIVVEPRGGWWWWNWRCVIQDMGWPKFLCGAWRALLKLNVMKLENLKFFFYCCSGKLSIFI